MSRPRSVFKICADYNLNRCVRPICSFVHEENPLASKDADLCYDYTKGKCTRDRCSFVHNGNPNAKIERVDPTPVAAMSGYGYGAYAAYGYPAVTADQLELQAQAQAHFYDSQYRQPYAAAASPKAEGCVRPRCTYMHDENPQTTGTKAPICTDFRDYGSCSRKPCNKAHNTNPQAGPDAPSCGDFKRSVLRSAAAAAAKSTLPALSNSPSSFPSCGRDTCTYVHDVNPNTSSASGNAECTSWVRRGSCSTSDCQCTHNVNPSAAVGAPSCGDFRRVYRQQLTPATSHFQEQQPPPPGLSASYAFSNTAAAAAASPSLSQSGTSCVFHPAASVSCGRPVCTFQHNVNTHTASDTTTTCRSFNSGTCTRPTCTYVHNVNAKAAENASVCGDFKRKSGVYALGGAGGMAGNMATAAAGYSLGGYAAVPFYSMPAMPAVVPDFRVCADFTRSRCQRDTCQFVHNSNPHADDNSSLCNDFSKGNCVRDRCKFLHNVNPEAKIRGSKRSMDQSDSQICNDFVAGRCRRPSCKFLHEGH